MNEPMEPEENALRQMNQAQPSPGLRHRVLQDFEHAIDPPSETGNTGWSLSMVLVAALVLVVASVGVFLLQTQFGDGMDSDMGTLTLDTAEDQFLIIQTHPDAQAVTVQDLATFAIVRVHVGETIKQRRLQQVSVDTLVLQDEDGSENRVPASVLNKLAHTQLQLEAQSYVDFVRNSHIQAQHLIRLQKLAYFGNADAIDCLETLEKENGALSVKAKEILSADRPVHRIRRVAELARQGSAQSRLQSIHALGASQSPVALQALKILAQDAPEVDALLCVELLSTRQASQSLPALQWIVENSISKRVKQSAQGYVDQIVQGVHEDK